MLNSLQAGRGLAAIAVLLFHASITIGRSTEVAPFWEVMQFGNRGVDFFFVLSGFIIMRAHQADIGQPSRWMNFARKRFIRIFPIYWFYTILVIGALLAGVGDFPLPQSIAGWLTTFTLLPISETITPLPQAWTLVHEMLFYIGFSLLIISRKLGLIVLVGWFLSCAAMLEYLPAERNPTLVLLNSYNINFALGIAAFYAVNYIKGIELVIAGIGLVLIALATTIIGFQCDLFFGVGFALLVAAGASIESYKTLNIPVSTLIGNASYSIYLTHEVLIVIGERISKVIGITDPYLLFALITSSSLVGGIVAYLLLEKPLLSLFKKKTSP